MFIGNVVVKYQSSPPPKEPAMLTNPVLFPILFLLRHVKLTTVSNCRPIEIGNDHLLFHCELYTQDFGLPDAENFINS